MVCTDRQLAQSERALGFSTRAGVVKQLRPYTGPNDISAIVDYMNRELVPVVQPIRNKLNEVYLQVAEMAPSANPLHYFFSESVAAADPTTGRLRLNQAVQNTATVIRVSELNARRISAAAWLDVMQGSATVPLGVVTLTDSADPGRFIRFDLGSMTDNGAYWDLNVTVVESSHTNPFVEGESVSVGFIAGVAAGTIAPAPGVPGLRAVSLVTLASSQSRSIQNATDSFLSSGTMNLALETGVFSRNNVFWRMSSNTLMGNAVQTYRADGPFSLVGLYAPQLSLINSNGVTFGISFSNVAGEGSVVRLTASVIPGIAAVSASNFGGSITSGTLVFSNEGGYTAFTPRVGLPNVMFSLNGSSIVASALVGFGDTAGPFVATRMDLINSNNMTFGATITSELGFGSKVIFTGSYLPQMGVVSHVGGNAQSSVTRLAFSNASGVTWSASTAASAVTMLASVNDQSIGVVSHVGGNVVSSVTRLAFSNASNVTFSLSTAAGAATLLASVLTSAQQTFIGGIAGGTQTATSGTVVFSDSNGISFGLSGSTRMTASARPDIGIVSHIGGNAVSSVTQLAFSNANNVTFSLSTAANAATLLASVAAAAGGGVAIGAASGGTATSGTVVFSNTTLGDNITSASMIENVVFSLLGSTRMAATAIFRVSDNLNATNTAGIIATKLVFNDANGIFWGAATTTNADGRFVQMTARMANVTYLKNWLEGRDIVGYAHGGALTTSGWVFPINQGLPMPGNMTINTADLWIGGNSANSTFNTTSFGWTLRGGLYSLNNSTQLTRINSFSSTFSQNSIATSLSASRNNSFNGDKAITIHSSVWSAEPVLSAGVAYWMQLNFSTAGLDFVSAFRYHELYQASVAGVWNNTASAAFVGAVPFCGFVTGASAPNATINSAAMNATFSVNTPMPVLQFRNNVAMF